MKLFITSRKSWEISDNLLKSTFKIFSKKNNSLTDLSEEKKQNYFLFLVLVLIDEFLIRESFVRITRRDQRKLMMNLWVLWATYWWGYSVRREWIKRIKNYTSGKMHKLELEIQQYQKWNPILKKTFLLVNCVSSTKVWITSRLLLPLLLIAARNSSVLLQLNQSQKFLRQNILGLPKFLSH